MTLLSRLAACSLAVALVARVGGALADDRDDAINRCIAANGDGQSLRRAHKLTDAREKFRSCSDPKCPALVAADCIKRLDEVDAAQPTIIFDVKDGVGHDLGNVAVTMDGRPFATSLDGSPLPVEPGEHAFTFTVPGGAPVTQQFVLKEGEKARHERITLGLTTPTVSPSPPPAAAPLTATKPAGGSGMKTIGLVVGGVGVAGLVVGTIFGVEALSTKSAHCGADDLCDPGWASTAKSQATLSTIGFVAGGVLAAGGAALFLLAPSGRGAEVAAGPMVGPSTGGLQIAGRW